MFSTNDEVNFRTDNDSIPDVEYIAEGWWNENSPDTIILNINIAKINEKKKTREFNRLFAGGK